MGIDRERRPQATAVVPAGVALETNSVAKVRPKYLNVEDTATVTWASTAGGVLKATAAARSPGRLQYIQQRSRLDSRLLHDPPSASLARVSPLR